MWRLGQNNYINSCNFNLEILNSKYAQLQVEYYSSNKEHLKTWEPEKSPKVFYTFKHQQNKIIELLELIKMENQCILFC